ncbi:MAG: PLP-dependent transferase, partial [Alphaproteobacteria bacterium]
MSEDEAKRNEGGLAPETLSAQALGRVDPVSRALVPSLHPSTTFERDVDGGYSSGRGYSRPHNPTYDEAENLLAALEGGHDCLLFASGMAAANAVFQSLLPGDHVVAPKVMYWALRKWLVDFAVSWGLEVEFADTHDMAALAAAMRPGKTKLVWIETPANPTWQITDIGAAAQIAHGARARLAVDGTVATPVLTRPLELGADLVVHSATKYLNGQGDVLAGAIVGARDDGFWQRIRAWRRDGGAMLGTLEAWLLQRGMRTLFVRVARCSASAMAIAQHFQDHPRISHVLYPGLPGHPGHDIAARQMGGGFGGMLSLRIRGGEAAAMAVAARVKVFKRATSLGGVESLIEHRASIEGPTTPVPSDLLRLSIGLEAVDDLIADLQEALDGLGKEIPVDEPPVEAPAKTPIERVLDDHVRAMVRERGGDLEVRAFEGGKLELGMLGSPGAAIPLQTTISNTIRHYLPEVREVEIVTNRTASTAATDDVQALLDELFNPAIAGHGGKVVLDRMEDGAVFLRLEGGCQGCAMAELTLRQGIEPVLKKQLPGIHAVIDVTDHGAGSAPYFKTKKS